MLCDESVVSEAVKEGMTARRGIESAVNKYWHNVTRIEGSAREHVL